MNTIFHKPTRDALIERINRLNEHSTAQWGKMNLYQMLKHCTAFEEMVLGHRKYKQAFIGVLFGKFALKSFLRDIPLKRNTPTVPDFRIKDTTGDLKVARTNWIALLEAYDQFTPYDFVHPFFGRMTTEQMGILSYKHTDHHLRQFGG